MTMEEIGQLYRLQGIDSAIAEREALIARLDDGSAAQAELNAEQAELNALNEALHRKRAEHRNLELELKGVEEDTRAKSDRAYGGVVSDPKELSALARKLAELERRKGSLEEKILGLLDDIEQHEQQAQNHQQTAERLAERLREITTTHDQQTQRARNELAELTRQRDELLPQVDAGLLRQYDDLRHRLEGVAIVAVAGRVCTGCNVAVPRSLEMKARRGNALVKCESCRRILYFADDSAGED